MLGESVGLRVNAQRFVVGDEHRLGGGAPLGGLVGVSPELSSQSRMALRAVCSRPQVALRHQVGVDVVLDERAVLVWSGHAVDPKAPGDVVMAERPPQPRGLYQ